MISRALLVRALLLGAFAAAPLFSMGGPAQALQRADLDTPSACQAGSDGVGALSLSARRDPMAPPRIDDDPVTVDVAVYVQQLTGISEVNYSFLVELYLEAVWCDPRLAYDAALAGTDRKVYLEEAAHARHQEHWWPDLMIRNAVKPPQTENEELFVFADGTVVYEARISAEVRGAYNFHKFPFDRQNLRIEIESFAWTVSDLRLRTNDGKIGFAEDFTIPSWDLVFHLAQTRTVKEVRDREPFSELILSMVAERRFEPYIYRLIAPIVLVIVASWSVFWLRPTSTGRFGVTFTTILTVVAFNFIVSRKLPNVPEITFIETFFGFSFLFLLFVVVENTLIDRLTAMGKTDLALRVDQVSRALFPLVYFSGAAAVAAAHEVI